MIFSQNILVHLRSTFKHLEVTLKNTRLRLVFSSPPSVFGNRRKSSYSWLNYHINSRYVHLRSSLQFKSHRIILMLKIIVRQFDSNFCFLSHIYKTTVFDFELSNHLSTIKCSILSLATPVWTVLQYYAVSLEIDCFYSHWALHWAQKYLHSGTKSSGWLRKLLYELVLVWEIQDCSMTYKVKRIYIVTNTSKTYHNSLFYHLKIPFYRLNIPFGWSWE